MGKPNFNKTISLLLSIVIVQISFIYTKKETESQQELIVYHTKKNTLISERIGKNISFISSDTLAKNNVSTSYLVGNFGVLKSTSKIKNTLFFSGKKILVLDSTGIYENKIQPDILLLTQSPKVNLDRLLKDLRPKIIIADASNSNSIVKNWKLTCIKKNIPFHATSEKGYYKLN
jgi:competence protein ComEC